MRLLPILLFVLAVLPHSVDAATTPRHVSHLDEAQFTLQVATFSDREVAERLLQSIPEAWIQETRKNGLVFYRVNYKRFSRRAEAVRAQWDLEDLGYEGMIQQLYG